MAGADVNRHVCAEEVLSIEPETTVGYLIRGAMMRSRAPDVISWYTPMWALRAQESLATLQPSSGSRPLQADC